MPIFLIACTSKPSEADGWEYSEEDGGYQRVITYARNDELTEEYLKGYEGTWTSSEDAETGFIIKNQEVYIGLHTDYVVFPASNVELVSNQWAFESENYEETEPRYYLSIDPPNFFKPDITEIRVLLGDLSNSNTGFGMVAQGENVGPVFYSMTPSSVNYRLYGNQSSHINEEEEEEEETLEEKRIREKLEEEEKEREAIERELVAKEREREKELEEQAREEERLRQEAEEKRQREEEERKLREQEQEKEEKRLTIRNIVDQNISEYLQGEYQIEIKDSNQLYLKIIPNQNALNGDIDSFMKSERERESPSNEWRELTQGVINISLEISDAFPDSEYNIQLMNIHDTVAYLAALNGEITQDFAHYYN